MKKIFKQMPQTVETHRPYQFGWQHLEQGYTFINQNRMDFSLIEKKI